MGSNEVGVGSFEKEKSPQTLRVFNLRNFKSLVLVIDSELITPNSPHPPLSPPGRGEGEGLMHFRPILTRLDGDFKRDRELHDALHFLLDHGKGFLGFFLRDLKDQFVVDLHDHLRR